MPCSYDETDRCACGEMRRSHSTSKEDGEDTYCVRATTLRLCLAIPLGRNLRNGLTASLPKLLDHVCHHRLDLPRLGEGRASLTLT